MKETKTKIVFFEVNQPWEKRFFQSALPPSLFDARFTAERLTSANAGRYADADVVSVFIYSKIDKTVLAQLPRLKLVVTNSTGYDHIDLAACAARGITVCNVPTYGENTVAEFAFALMLALTRKIVPSVNAVKARKTDLDNPGLAGLDLKGKTLGVIGTGRIGKHSIRIGAGFGMVLLAYDVYPDKSLERQFPLRYQPLEEVLAGSDIITVHAPYMKQTHHLLNSKNLKKVKPGALLINTARGGLVETAGLVSALKSGRLAGAGLDVLEDEQLIFAKKLPKQINASQRRLLALNRQLVAMDNVIITPHNAFNSREAIERILSTTADNIRAFLAGKPANAVK